MALPDNLEQYRGKRWEILRAYEDPDHALLVLHKAFEGNAAKAAEFLGFDRHVLLDKWAALGLGRLGKEKPRRGRNADFSPWPERSLEDWDAHLTALSEEEEKALVCQWELPERFRIGKLCPVADLHAQSVACDWGRFKQFCGWLKRNRQAMTFLGGDTFDLATKNGRSSITEQACPLRVALSLVERQLEPVAAQVICVFSGNHDERIRLEEDVEWNPAEELAKRLGVPYMGIAGHIIHRIGTETYKHWHHHGVGAARTDGAKLNRGKSLENLVRADIVTVGHLHMELIAETIRREAFEDGSVRDVATEIALLPSFQRYRGYPVAKGLSPSALGVSTIELDSKEHRVHVRK